MSKQVISLVGGEKGAPILNERVSGEAGILAGHLVEESAGTVVKHSAAAGTAQKIFALPNMAIGGDIDTAYANGETVIYGAYHSGQEVNVLVAAGATAIADGDPLESAGDGTLRKVSTSAATADTSRNSTVAYAMVAVDNSGGATAVRISARVA